MNSQLMVKKILPTILIVDTNLASLGETVKNLESQGYCVYPEQNGVEGLQRASIEQPDIILLDVAMPEIDGFEICRRLKKQTTTRDIPVIIMAEPPGGMSKVTCFEAGAVDYLSKPLQIDEVTACVQTQFNLSSMQKRLEIQNAQLLRYREQLEQRVAERTRELSDSNQRLRTEIQERKLMEEQLKLKEFVLDRAGDAVYLIDRTPHFVYANDEACRALGYRRDELLAMGPFDIDPNITPQDTQRFREQMDAAGLFTYETSHRRRDGSLFPVEVRGALIEYQGQLMSLALVRDITERKRAEKMLLQREHEYRSLAENLPDNIARWDSAGRYLYLNPAHESSLRKPATEILGKRAGEVFTDGRFDQSQQVLAKVVETGLAQLMSVPVPQDDGSLRIHEVSYVPEQNAQGEIVGVLGIGRDMTEQIRLQEAIVQSEAALRSLTDSAPFSIIRYDIEGRITYVNAPLLGFFGIPLAELIGKLPREVWTDGRFAEIDQGIAQVQKTKAEVVVEFSELGAESKTVHHQVWIVPEKDTLNELVGIIAFGLDITGRKRAEREVHLLNCALDNSFDATYLLGADLRFRYVNEAAVRALGYSREELLTLSLLDIDPNITREAVQELMRQTAVGSYPDTVESCHRRKNGETFPIEVGASMFSYGDEILFLTTVRDITLRKQAEQALATRENEFRSLAENIPDNLIRYDLQGNLVYVNSRLEKTLGRKASDLIGKNTREIHPDGSFEVYVRTLFGVIASGESKEIDFVLPGSARVHQMNFVPERNAAGELIGVITIGHDITELKQAKHELEEYRAELRGLIAHREQAREEERKLIAREVHDELGQILSGLQLNVSLVADKCAANSESLREHFNESMILIDQAIGVARNVASTLRPVELDMGIVASLEWLVNRFATYSGIQCEIHIADQELRLKEDSSIALFRIVQESLTNVARHAQADKLSISLSLDGDDCILKIRDNGVGFDASVKKKSSFGLVGIRERTLLQGGALSINSCAGAGTEIVVRIPCKEKL